MRNARGRVRDTPAPELATLGTFGAPARYAERPSLLRVLSALPSNGVSSDGLCCIVGILVGANHEG